jgi:hypothetical protein
MNIFNVTREKEASIQLVSNSINKSEIAEQINNQSFEINVIS